MRWRLSLKALLCADKMTPDPWVRADPSEIGIEPQDSIRRNFEAIDACRVPKLSQHDQAPRDASRSGDDDGGVVVGG